MCRVRVHVRRHAMLVAEHSPSRLQSAHVRPAQRSSRTLCTCSSAAGLALAGYACRADCFSVPLDETSIGALRGKFFVLELPSATCRGDGSAVQSDGPDRGDGGLTWHPHCAYGLTKHVECEYNGFQYSMEWYFMQMLRDNPIYSASSAEEAQFIYFPQCVSQIYFALRSSYNMTHWAAIEAAELEYLVPLLRWAHSSPYHKQHGGKNFWTVFSMDLGRQDFPRSAAWLEDWSVGSLTGSDRWMHEHDAFHAPPPENSIAGDIESDGGDTLDTHCWKEDTAPVALANELFPARNYKEYDTVISIPSRFTPTQRSMTFEGRPVLAFFAGSPNSCARRRVLEMYGGVAGFDVSTTIRGNEDYRERMWSSQFCLVFRGSSHTNNVRLYDVLAHGCVPVIISDDFQPVFDLWLPWHDIAVFLPTAAIPRLQRVLRDEITEKRRKQLFENVALGRSSLDDTRVKNLLKASGGALDGGSLWSGLSAARVFDWERADFWLLFYADVARKLTQRMSDGICTDDAHADRLGARVDPRVLANAVEVTNQATSTSGAVQFRWQRVDWRAPRKCEQRESRPVRATLSDNDRRATSELVAALRWLYDIAQRQRRELPGVIVDCGSASAGEAGAWFESLAAKSSSASMLSEGVTSACCLRQPPARSCGKTRADRAPSVAAVSLEPSATVLEELRQTIVSHSTQLAWRGVHANLDDDAVIAPIVPQPVAEPTPERLRLADVVELGKEAAAPAVVSPAVFLLRVGPRCWRSGLRALRNEEASAPVKFFLVSLRGANSVFAAKVRQGLVSLSGWLCFAVVTPPVSSGVGGAFASGILRPTFSPFHSSAADDAASIFCGREDDPDLDMVVRPLPAADSLGPSRAPLRWGAGGARASVVGKGVGAPPVVAAMYRGRFLYAAA